MNINDVPKYKKKKKPKTDRRADHKHEYEMALIKSYEIDNKKIESYNRMKYCIICGKIYETYFLESERIEGTKFCKFLTDEEKLIKYKDLKILEIENLRDKYVKLDNN